MWSSKSICHLDLRLGCWNHHRQLKHCLTNLRYHYSERYPKQFERWWRGCWIESHERHRRAKGNRWFCAGELGQSHHFRLWLEAERVQNNISSVWLGFSAHSISTSLCNWAFGRLQKCIFQTRQRRRCAWQSSSWWRWRSCPWPESYS